MSKKILLLISIISIFFIPAESATATVEGYYKDLFSDGGCRLGSTRSLPAAKYLNLSVEYLATSDPSIQSKIIIQADNGLWKDDNGVLLYPDGAPRFRCFFSNGGKSIPHGQSLGQTGRQRIRNFFNNGGSYTGSCAGSAIASIKATSGKSDQHPRKEYYHIWPARVRYTGLASSHTDITIPKSSPLLKYFDFGGDYRINNLRHNGGNYTIENDDFWWCKGTEVLARFAEPIEGEDQHHRDFIGQVSVWAYKPNTQSGRLAVCGSHPELVKDGEIRDLQAALLKYAMAGNGSPNLKATLENRVTRRMINNQSKGYEKIGDLQYHHFKIDLPSKSVKKLIIVLKGRPGIDMNLYLKKNDFAFKGSKEVIEAKNTNAPNEIISLNNISGGQWYIGVKCNESVKGKQKRPFFDYTENLNLLNGVPYLITASWSE